MDKQPKVDHTFDNQPTTRGMLVVWALWVATMGLMMVGLSYQSAHPFICR